MILRVILLDSQHQRWLATHTGELPFATIDSQSLREGVEGALSSLLSNPVRLLFTPYRTENEAIFVVEWLEAGSAMPAALHWSADEAPLSIGEREAVKHARQPHPLRVPWARPGWLGRGPGLAQRGTRKPYFPSGTRAFLVPVVRLSGTDPLWMGLLQGNGTATLVLQ